MKLVPALEWEKMREDETMWNKVYINKEGKFYHIYEWSAWLVKTILCTEDFQKERGDEKVLAANRYKAKGNEYVMIGFPVESLSKYIPEYATVECVEGGDLIVTIDLPENFGGFDEILEAFESWKLTCPYKEKKAKSHHEIISGNSNAQILAHSGMFAIAQQILAYPVESSTPADNISFIGRIKQMAASLL